MSARVIFKRLNQLFVFLLVQLLVIYPLIQKTATKAQAAVQQTVDWQVSEDVIIQQYTGNQVFRDHLSAGYSYADVPRSASLLKFGNQSLPSGAIVQNAKLHVRQYSHTVMGGHTLFASRITNNWSDSSVLWGGVGFDMDTASRSVGNYLQDVELDVTEIVKSWQAGASNYGIAIRSNNNYTGGSYCSVRQPSSGGVGGHVGYCNGYRSWVEVNYIINDSPNEPVLVQPNSGRVFGGRPYANCVQNDGCDVYVQFDNIGDPNGGTAGEYEKTTIYFEPIGIGNLETREFTNTGTVSGTMHIRDGRYNVFAISRDRLGLERRSNNATIKVDTTAPNLPTIITEPEFTKGLQNQVDANPTTDVNNLSNPVQYQFCRYDNATFTAGEHCSLWMDSPTFGFGSLQDDKQYFYRVQARDAVNLDLTNPNTGNHTVFSTGTSSIQDATLPILNNVLVNGQTADRISPFQIDGVKDNAEITFTVKEKYFKEAKYQVVDVLNGNAIVRQNNAIASCTPNDTVTTDAERTCTVTVDGKNDAGVFLADGGYKIKLVALDKAGNEAFNDNLAVVVDNTPGAISITLPQNNSFVNTPNTDIKGQVVSEDEAKLFVTTTLVNGGVETEVPLQCIDIVTGVECTPTTPRDQAADSYFLNKNFDLNLGENLFTFRSDDSVSNEETKVLKITREEELPVINSILVDGTTPGLTKNRKPTLNFAFSDPNTQGYGQSGINQNSINLTLINANNEELILVTNGQNQSALGNLNTTCGDTSLTTGSINCNFNYVFHNELAPDSIYTIKIQLKDRASNEISDSSKSFNLDSNTYQVVTNPTNGNVFARKNVVFSGKGEKGATLKILNTELNKQVSIVLDEANSNTGIDGELVMSNFEIVCNEEVDFDNSIYTTNPICAWSVTLNQKSNNTTPGVVQNTNVISTTDLAGNVLSQNLITKIDLFALDIKFTPDLSFISTDGNGKQDGITYTNSIANTSNPDDEPLVTEWNYKVFKSDAGNRTLVRTITGQNSLPGTLYFDGKDQVGNWIADGNYDYELKVITLDNPNLPLVQGSFTNITRMTQGVFITYPSGTSSTNPFITSNGVTNIQGQASLPTETATEIRYEDVSVKICVDTIGLDTNCDFEYTTTVDNVGFFSRVIPLVRLADNTDHILQARLVDKFGNESDLSNKVYVRVNTLDPFKEVKVIPVYSGVNKAETLQKLNELLVQYEEAVTQPERDGIGVEIQSEVAKLRKIILRSRVTQDTSYVKLAYSDLTNVAEMDGTEVKKNIGWVDNRDFNYIRNVLGPILYDLGGATLTDKCLNVECTWDFDYVVPNLSGGIYEVTFTGRKGQEEQAMSASLIIDANVLAKPLILDINKLNNGTPEHAKLFGNKYYSNKKTIELKGVASPGSNIVVKDSISGATICTVVTSEIGIFSCENITLPTGANLEQEFALQTIATKGPQSETSEEDTLLRYDEKAPEFTNYQNLNSNHSEIIKKSIPSVGEPILDSYFRQAGDQVEVEITANEDLDYAFIKNKYELFEYAFVPDSSNPALTKGYFQVEGYAEEGVYDVIVEIADRAGNKNQEIVNYVVDNTNPDFPDQDKTLWGLTTAFERRGLPDAQFQPANNRLLVTSEGQNYVINTDSIGFYGFVEKDTYPILVIDNVEVNAVRTQGQCGDVNKEEKKAPDGTIVKAKTYCLWQFDYKFPTEKSYRVQLRTEDKSGNRSELTYQYLLEYDKTAPKYFDINNAKSAKFNPIVDWKQNGQTTYYNDGRGDLNPVTNQLNLTLEGQTEQLADVEYIVLDPQGNQLDYQKFINNFYQKHSVDFKLGTELGGAQDGNYTIIYRSGDSADNETELKYFSIERDTVAPADPRVSAGMAGLYNITASVQGEEYSNSSLLGNLGAQGARSGNVKTLNINNDADWEATFTFCSTLADRATNTSGSKCASVRTPIRPPRAGECDWTDAMQEKYRQIQTGEVDTQDVVSELGFSKSCKTYAADAIQDGLKKGQEELKTKRDAAQTCIQTKLQEGKSGTDAAKECGAAEVFGKEATDKLASSIDENQRQMKIKQETAQNCLQEAMNNNKSVDEGVDSCGFKDLYGEDAANTIKGNVKGAQDEARKKAEEEQKRQEEANKCEWTFNVFSEKNCVNRGVKATVDFVVDVGKGIWDGAVSVVKGIGSLLESGYNILKDGAKAIESLIGNGVAAAVALGQTAFGNGSFSENFNSNKQFIEDVTGRKINNPIDDLKNVGKAVALVAGTAAVIAGTIALAPVIASGAAIIATAGAAVGSALGVGATVGTAIVGFGAALGITALTNVATAAVSAVNISKDGISFDGNKFNKGLKEGFCGSADASVGKCIGYTIGQTATGELIGFGVGKAATNASKALKGATNLVDNVAPLADDAVKLTDDVIKISDDATRNLTKLDDGTKLTDDLIKNTDDLIDNVDDLIIDSKPNRVIMNKEYAGRTVTSEELLKNKEWVAKEYPDLAKKYPDGVEYRPDGTPEFSPYAKSKYSMKDSTFHFDENNKLLRSKDFAEADAWYKDTYGVPKPEDYVWHHHYDKKTLLLVPKDVHSAFKHTGFLF